MFSLTCILTKNNVKLLPIEISSKKVRTNNVYFSTYKITSKKVSGNNVDFLARESTLKKVRGNNVDFSNIEITSKKVRGKNVDISTIEITSKKVRENDMDFSISEITLKSYVEMTWKFVEVWSSLYRRNIDVESTSIRRGVPVGYIFQEIVLIKKKSFILTSVNRFVSIWWVCFF